MFTTETYWLTSCLTRRLIHGRAQPICSETPIESPRSQSLIHLLIDWLIHSLIYVLTQSLTYLVSHALTKSNTHPPTHVLWHQSTSLCNVPHTHKNSRTYPSTFVPYHMAYSSTLPTIACFALAQFVSNCHSPKVSFQFLRLWTCFLFYNTFLLFLVMGAIQVQYCENEFMTSFSISGSSCFYLDGPNNLAVRELCAMVTFYICRQSLACSASCSRGYFCFESKFTRDVVAQVS